ncbi:MAG: class I SAM-dependent methyltransferase [Actinomycetia bacterium]|nr:class I SAM-dependent methyltransferase [Actinomycetes bacterium]
MGPTVGEWTATFLPWSDGGMEERVARWEELWAEPFVGWDFSEFEGRVEESQPPWSYEELVQHELTIAGSALDLGTGGGEFLREIFADLPVEMHATEGWESNLPIAREALEPLGIEVRRYDAERDEALPYADESVDLVLCRHEAYRASEVVRVLRPGGWFLTQQVDGRNLDDLAQVFGAGPAFPDITLAVLRAEAEEAGLIIEQALEWSGPIRFDSVETLVSYLRCMPWQLPDDFTIERYAEQLVALDDGARPLEFTERRFLILAHRAAPDMPPADPFAAQW